MQASSERRDESSSRSSRRSGRSRDVPEPARDRLLRAGLEEFGAKGYAGATTRGIAARAGMNQQLISYYFGGKQGLLEELRACWAATESALVSPQATFRESLATYLDMTLDRPDWARLVIWRALDIDPGDDEYLGGQRAKLQASVDRIRRRQRDGELPGDVEAEFVLVLAYMLAFAPIAMPQLVEAIFGVAPCSREYRRRCLEQMLRLLDPDRLPLGTPTRADHE